MADQYNLSIYCVDGDTIYGLISSDKSLLRGFLKLYDHEGSSINLCQSIMGPDGSTFKNFDCNLEVIYKELEWPS